MSDPISLDDMDAATAPATPVAAPAQPAQTGPITVADMDKAVQEAPKPQAAAPQFEGVWRKPAIFLSGVAKGAINNWAGMMDASGTANLTQGLALQNVINEATGDPARTPLTQGRVNNLPKIDAAAQASGIIDRPDLQPQGIPEHIIAGAGQGVGAAASSGVVSPRALVPAAGSGVGAEAAHETFPNSTLAPVVGALLGGGITQVPGAALSASRSVVRPFTAEGQGSVVDDLIRKAAVNPSSLDNLPSPPLPGMNLTLGQLSNDPGIQALERGVEGNTPAAQGAVNARATQNNGVIRDAIGSLHSEGVVSNPADAMADASTRMRSALDANLTAARSQEKQLWAGLDAQAPTDQLKQDVESYASGKPIDVDGNPVRLTKARQQFLPDNLVASVKNLGGTEPLEELTDLRSVISTAQREAYNAGEWNKANVIGGLDKIILNRINNLDVPPEQINQYNQARQFSADLNDKYSKGIVSKVLGNDQTGADRVAPTATGSQFVKSGPGGLEAIQSYLKAVGNNGDGLQAAKDYAIANMLKQGSSGRAVDLNGRPKIDFGALNSHLNNSQHVLESGLFSPDELDQIEAAHSAADMASRTARSQLPYGSSTAEKIKSGQYVDIPVSPLVPKIAGAVAGAVAGGHAGPVGSIIGGLEGGKFAGKLYSGPNTKIGEALQQRLIAPLAQQPAP